MFNFITKNLYARISVVLLVLILGILVVLPKTAVKSDKPYFKADTSIGGYQLNLFDGKFVRDLSKFKLGLDLSGGVRVVLKANMDNIAELDRKTALESAKNVIERRVNLLGISEPYITTSQVGNDSRIIVELPGIEDVNAAMELIGKTAQLKFKVLDPNLEWTPEKFQEYYFEPKSWVETNVTGADLNGVDIEFSNNVQSNSPQIRLRFSNAGRQKFSELAKANIGKPVALYLDQDPFPLSAPVVSEDLAKGLTDDPVISGNFDVETAKGLSVQLRAGALPVPVEVLEQQTIDATLGADSVHKSLFAGFVGLTIVLVFLVFLYGRMGFFASIGLIIYSIVTLAIFKFIPVVLTLPGIAGFILSIGMATDANVLIFERIKEELEWGTPRQLAVKAGFDRAWSSIKDSNFTSLLASFILFYFGDGPVRGFALTLALGIIVSLFSALFVVRTLLMLIDVLPDNPNEPKGLKKLLSFGRKK